MRAGPRPCCTGSMHRQIAGKLTGRVTKWIVLVLWVGVTVVARLFAAKLADEQNNGPRVAARERRVHPRPREADRLPGPELHPHPRRLREELRAHRTRTWPPGHGRCAGVRGSRRRRGRGPSGGVPVRGRAGAADRGHLQLRRRGLERDARRADALREIADVRRRDRLHRRRRRPGRGLARHSEGSTARCCSRRWWSSSSSCSSPTAARCCGSCPIFSAGVALISSQALIYFLARYADLTVNGQSSAILTILVIGAGTDYALLLVARYREELRRHADRHEAMAFALHRAARPSWPAPPPWSWGCYA